MRLLELFSGTGSIGKVFSANGWDVLSLDINPKSNATITVNILEWNYRELVSHLGQQPFDCIWASPCCTHYSVARTKASIPRDLVGADELVLKVLEIIQYFQPRTWFVENPQTGLLKSRSFMADLPFTDLDYCCYSDYGYRKRTRIWNNAGLKGLLCEGAGKCPNMTGRRHNSTAQQGRNKCDNGYRGLCHKQRDLYKIPEKLCVEICSAASCNTGEAITTRANGHGHAQ